ncbi:MAG TPA: class I SAM-dependent methyltransferase, partial [Streptosporangiaceae bacterium]|nr:class I SAM-dependent methyltransferase [Streptosporangiaceae bacterium]
MHDDAPLWADQAFLRNVQYVTDRNLAARQAIYAFQRPKLDLPAAVLGSLALSGTEVIADIGCGNGAYLAELHRRGHLGQVIGLDASPGMLGAAAPRCPGAALVNGDAMELPLADSAADVTLAMHMLYHVPDPAAAVAELKRVTAPGGRTVIALNGDDHQRELRAVIGDVAGAMASSDPGWDRIRLDEGEAHAAGMFGSVIRHDFAGQLEIPDPGPVADYVRSMSLVKS